MSVVNSGREIWCDASGCEERTEVPIALHEPCDEGRPAARGWLFVVSQDLVRHYCPHCAVKQTRLHMPAHQSH
jgi:hypothetical protein